jgi:hypothetical protein
MRLTWIVATFNLVFTGCTAVPMIAAKLDPDRFKAGAETRSRCKEDGGIRVYQKIEMQQGRFPTLIPDTTNSSALVKQGSIYGKYRYQESYSSSNFNGYTIYRYQTSITSIKSGKLIGQMVRYVLATNNVYAHGFSCPEGLTNEKFIRSVFSQESDESGSYPACTVGSIEKLFLSPNSPAEPVKLNVIFNSNDQRYKKDWERGINCDERTKIDLWYGKTGTNSIGVTSTRLLFFGLNGEICQTFAMPLPEMIACDENGVYVFDWKQKAKDGVVKVQKFSKTGQMISEIEISHVAPYNDGMVSYLETESSIEFRTALFDHNDINKANCYLATISKQSLGSLGNKKRIGPPDIAFGYTKCAAD